MKTTTLLRAQKIHAWLTVALALALPMSKRIVPPIIVLWILSSFFLFRSQHVIERRNVAGVSKRFFLPSLALIALITYYLLNVCWVGRSADQHAAIFGLEVKLSMLVFPLTWMFLPAFELRQRLDVLLALVWGCLAFVGISLMRAIWVYATTGDSGAFFYADLAWYFHPTYLATYEALSLVVLGRMHVKKVFALGKPWVHQLTAAILIIHVGLLESRAGYLCALLALLLVSLQQFKRKRSLEAIAYLLIGSGLLAATVVLSPSSKERLKEAVSAQPQLEQAFEDPGHAEAAKATSSTGGRLVAWRASLELMMRNPLGVGTGDVTDELVKIYERDGEDYALKKQLNPHNQFLQAGVAFGWTGLLVLLIIFMTGLFLALQRRDFLFLSFLLLLGLNMIFESFLEVQSGVVFFAFFYGFFVKGPPRV